MPSLVKRSTAPVTAAQTPAPAAQTSSRTRGPARSAGGFKFQYHKRTAEEVAAAAKQAGGREFYFADDVEFFTASQGQNTIRILPPPTPDWHHYGLHVWEHRDIGANADAYLCLAKMRNEPCAVCDARERATAAGDKALSDDLRPNRRTAMYIIERAQAQKGPQLWLISSGYKKSLDTNLLNLCNDPTEGLLLVDDPDAGFDLTFTRTGQGMLGTVYTGWSFARRPSPLSDMPEQYEKWLRYVLDNNIETKLILPDYEAVQNALLGQPPGGSRKAQQQQGQQQQSQPPQQRRTLAPRSQPQEQAAPPVQQQATQTQQDDGPVEGAPTWQELTQMDEDTLIKVGDVFEVEWPSGFEEQGADGNDGIRLFLAEQLNVKTPEPEPPPPPASVAAGGGSWQDRLAKMQGK